jgi:hypothetical protein
MRAIVEGIAIDTHLGQQIVFARMASQIPRGRVIKPETVEYIQGNVVVDGNTVRFTISGRGIATGQIDAGQIQNQLAGKSLEDALSYLLNRVDIAENTAPEITLSANPFNRMPILSMRIRVVTEEVIVPESTSEASP